MAKQRTHQLRSYFSLLLSRPDRSAHHIYHRLGGTCTAKNNRRLYTQESLPNAKVSARQPCLSKTDFDVKLALKVFLRHFAINYRQTGGSISPCNIAGFISDVSEDVATQIAKICRRRQPHSHLTPPPRGTNPREYPHKPYFSRN